MKSITMNSRGYYEYREKHKKVLVPELNPEEEELNVDLWKSNGEFARRISHGRVLGIGSSTQATTIFRPTMNVNIGPSVEMLARLEELHLKKRMSIKGMRRRWKLGRKRRPNWMRFYRR